MSGEYAGSQVKPFLVRQAHHERLNLSAGSSRSQAPAWQCRTGSSSFLSPIFQDSCVRFGRFRKLELSTLRSQAGAWERASNPAKRFLVRQAHHQRLGSATSTNPTKIL